MLQPRNHKRKHQKLTCHTPYTWRGICLPQKTRWQYPVTCGHADRHQWIRWNTSNQTISQLLESPRCLVKTMSIWPLTPVSAELHFAGSFYESPCDLCQPFSASEAGSHHKFWANYPVPLQHHTANKERAHCNWVSLDLWTLDETCRWAGRFKETTLVEKATNQIRVRGMGPEADMLKFKETLSQGNWRQTISNTVLELLW